MISELAGMLGDPLMQRALVVACLVGLVAPVIGTYLVQRRLSLLGDGIGHVALTGVALGWLVGNLTNLVPKDALAIPGAVLAAVVGAVVIELVRPCPAVLRRHRGRRADHVPGRWEQREPGRLSVRLDLHRVDPGPGAHRRTVRRGAGRRRRPASGTVRGLPRRGVRPGRRTARAGAEQTPTASTTTDSATVST